MTTYPRRSLCIFHTCRKRPCTCQQRTARTRPLRSHRRVSCPRRRMCNRRCCPRRAADTLCRRRIFLCWWSRQSWLDILYSCFVFVAFDSAPSPHRPCTSIQTRCYPLCTHLLATRTYCIVIIYRCGALINLFYHFMIFKMLKLILKDNLLN